MARMCTSIAGRGMKHRCKPRAQVATHTNKGVSETSLAEVIAGIKLAGGVKKENVGPVKRREVNVHERARGTTADRRCSTRLSRGHRWC
jgi:hypothetical protein